MAFLCEDELLHIFSYVPTKLICQIRSLSKSLLEYTSETRFCMKHAENLSQKDDTCIIIQSDTWFLCGNNEIHPLPEEKKSFGIPRNSMELLANARPIASSNGLILCRRRNSADQVELFILNPTTQSMLSIATPNFLLNKPHGSFYVIFKCMNNKAKDLGGDDDYLIICIESPPEWGQHVIVKVYSSMEGEWKAKEKNFFIGGMNMKHINTPVFVHGALHVISDCPTPYRRGSPYYLPYIMSYNLETGESIKIPIPKDARRDCRNLSCDMRIFEWGKENSMIHSLCLIRYLKNAFTIWILMDYKCKIWTRILKIRLKGMKGLKENDLQIQGFTMMNGYCLVFATSRKVYTYDCNQIDSWECKELCDHKLHDLNISFIPHSITLRPCGTGATYIPASSSYSSSATPSPCYTFEDHMDIYDESTQD